MTPREVLIGRLHPTGYFSAAGAADATLSVLSAAGFEIVPTALVDAVVAHQHGSRCQNCLQNALAIAAYRRAPVQGEEG